ncbi:type IV pilus twitching motility protein PilT [Herbivorax sp. ANBcel31]|uniref:type IV pilus twitching motility protein PilT n=1 Tax=Herbivorax sp. ANBcel31 TaxID=3069754 RepID=UPI0027B4BBA3|nr:type IV pilus twitching motility protein PilT [Herbivorax sp. ANBcel31]MDQ2085282.1 type IV pilus twitching motility protein PilT [Herbivorax sp. ANBcel31]
MNLEKLLETLVNENGSDLHITVGIPPTIRKNGRLIKIGEKDLSALETEDYITQITDKPQMEEILNSGHVDFSFSLEGIGRFRVNSFKQRGSFGAAIRLVNSKVKTIQELGLPDVVSDMARKTKGLILVTGPTGSGKTTSLAAIINQINEERDCHILTLEDPIEYLHRHKKAIVNQREIGNDAISYSTALKAALREDPDVILVGEMRDIDTISIAITAAETGHLVLSTLHTTGAASTIDRIIDVFPPHQQQQIRIQLSVILQGVVSQQLLPRFDKKGRAIAVEVMMGTPAVRNLIREGKTHQIDSLIQTGSKFGMQSMDSSLVNLYRDGFVDYDDILAYAVSSDNILRLIGGSLGGGSF